MAVLSLPDESCFEIVHRPIKIPGPKIACGGCVLPKSSIEVAFEPAGHSLAFQHPSLAWRSIRCWNSSASVSSRPSFRPSMVLTRNESELNASLWLFQLPRRCKARVPSPRRNLDIFDALFLAHLLPLGGTAKIFVYSPRGTNAPSDEEAGGVGLCPSILLE